MSDGIDAGVDPMQPARRDPGPHGPRLQPEPDELGKGDDPVLPSRKFGDRSLQPFGASGRFRHLYVRNRPLASHGEIVAPLASRFSTRE